MHSGKDKRKELGVMRKNLKAAVSLLLLGMLAGCGNQTAEDQNTENQNTENQNTENQNTKNQNTENQDTGAASKEQPGGEESADRSDVASQLELIADNMELWMYSAEYANEVYAYTVTDLDLNGRLELIAANAGGTGIYTYSNYFEVNSTFDGLEQCERDAQEGNSQADIITGSVCAYVDAQTGTVYYIFDDYLRNGATEFYEAKIAVSLTDGRITEEVLASRSSIYTDDESEAQIHVRNGQQQEITEEEYENIADSVFAGSETKWVSLSWLTYPGEDGTQQLQDLNREELLEKLQECYDGFITCLTEKN